VRTRSPVTLTSQCKVEGISRENISDRVERDRGVTAAPGWPERTIIVDYIELLVDADYTPAAVIAWEEHCKPITQANIAVGERVAIGDVRPPEDLGEGCDHNILSKRTHHLTYRSVWSHISDWRSVVLLLSM
jgi:hypothetical protein